MIEILGIIASCFVLSSFLTNDIKKVRVVNIIGAILYIIYGYYINSISNIILNSVLVIVHIYNLYKLERRKKI